MMLSSHASRRLRDGTEHELCMGCRAAGVNAADHEMFLAGIPAGQLRHRGAANLRGITVQVRPTTKVPCPESQNSG
ncbi:hypothetical protein ABIB82_004802 [Bradyrhizobium sp. i1.8.4]|uniref:hypothetical protein n=1 Tax=unclassified Bradyrhizobium TaxID=2631580 RepID=UPI003D230C41